MKNYPIITERNIHGCELAHLIFLQALMKINRNDQISITEEELNNFSPHPQYTEQIITELQRNEVLDCIPDQNKKQHYLIILDELTIRTIKIKLTMNYNDLIYYQNEITNLWCEIASYEALEYFEYLLQKIGVTEYSNLAELQTKFANLLQKFSLGQVIFMLYNSYNYARKLKEKRTNITNAEINNILIGCTLRYAHLVEFDNWQILTFERPYALTQSILSNEFFEQILRLGNDTYMKLTPFSFFNTVYRELST